MLCLVAIFAGEKLIEMTYRVATFAYKINTNDIDICLRTLNIFANGNIHVSTVSTSARGRHATRRSSRRCSRRFETRAKKQHFKQHVRPWLGSASRSSTRSNPSAIGIAVDASPTGRRCHKTNVQGRAGICGRTDCGSRTHSSTACKRLASDDLSVVLAAGPTLRQRRQLALRALKINKYSLLEGSWRVGKPAS